MPGPPEPKTWDPILQAYVGPWHTPPTQTLVRDGTIFGGHKGFFQWARAFAGPHPADSTDASLCAWQHARRYANGGTGDFVWYSSDYNTPYVGDPACPAFLAPFDQYGGNADPGSGIFVGSTYASDEDVALIPGFMSWSNRVRMFGVSWSDTTADSYPQFQFYEPPLDDWPIGAVTYVRDLPVGLTQFWTPQVASITVQPFRQFNLHPTVETLMQFWIDNRIDGDSDNPTGGNVGWGYWNEYLLEELEGGGTNATLIVHWLTGDPTGGLPLRGDRVLDYTADTFPVGSVPAVTIGRLNGAHNKFDPDELLPEDRIWGYAIADEVVSNTWPGDVGHPVVRTRGVDGVNFRWTIVFQPYPYRFVYERVPPLRQWPRDDDPQATGVRQLSRRSSRQKTQRQGWGGTYL